MSAYAITHGQPQPGENNAAWSQIPQHLQALSRELVRNGVFEDVGAHHSTILSQWVSLVKETTLPINLSSSSPEVMGAFQRLVDATVSKSGMEKRLAHIRLLEFFDYLELLVQSEKTQGLHPDRVRNRGITIVDHVISSVLPTLGKNKLSEIRRVARRWKTLAGPSVFFLMVYTDVADRIVRDFKRINNSLLDLLARHTIASAPVEYIRLFKQLETKAEQDIRWGDSCNSGSLQMNALPQSC